MSRLNGIPGWFMKTRPGKEAQAEAEAQLVSDRKAMVVEIQRLADEAASKLEPLDEEMQELEPRLREIRNTLQTVKAQLDRAKSEAQNVRLNRDHKIDRLKAQLRMSADPRIEQFQEECRGHWEETRRRQLDTCVYGETNMLGHRPQVNNYEAITARMDSLREAVRKAENLKVLDLTSEEVDARLEEIRAEIPGIRPAEDFLPDGATPARYTLPAPDPEPREPAGQWAHLGKLPGRYGR